MLVSDHYVPGTVRGSQTLVGKKASKSLALRKLVFALFLLLALNLSPGQTVTCLRRFNSLICFSATSVRHPQFIFPIHSAQIFPKDILIMLFSCSKISTGSLSSIIHFRTHLSTRYSDWAWGYDKVYTPQHTPRAVLVYYGNITSYPKTWWLKTTNEYYLSVSVGQVLRSEKRSG